MRYLGILYNAISQLANEHPIPEPIHIFEIIHKVLRAEL